ncbi:MAG: hypothetical protein N3E51_03825 [Candidatus Micrarchaeota archaeon]|nr:hypothetical protein [Candidatus Micrarchaeota archaeon]
MKIENALSAKGLLFIALFTAISLAASAVNFSPLLGAQNQSFTFFQFFGPIAGGFLGAGAGVLSVFLAQLISFIWLGTAPELFSIARLFPMLFAALYFARYAKGNLAYGIVPLACMALFVLHPVGSQAWFYSLYWLIPIIALALPEHLFLRSLGSTFTAHAVGSVAFLYLIPSTPALWVALIPVVAFERGMFALGISASFVAFNTLFSRVDALAKSGLLSIDQRYVLAPAKA